MDSEEARRQRRLAKGRRAQARYRARLKGERDAATMQRMQLHVSLAAARAEHVALVQRRDALERVLGHRDALVHVLEEAGRLLRLEGGWGGWFHDAGGWAWEFREGGGVWMRARRTVGSAHTPSGAALPPAGVRDPHDGKLTADGGFGAATTMRSGPGAGREETSLAERWRSNAKVGSDATTRSAVAAAATAVSAASPVATSAPASAFASASVCAVSTEASASVSSQGVRSRASSASKSSDSGSSESSDELDLFSRPTPGSMVLSRSLSLGRPPGMRDLYSAVRMLPFLTYKHLSPGQRSHLDLYLFMMAEGDFSTEIELDPHLESIDVAEATATVAALKSALKAEKVAMAKAKLRRRRSRYDGDDDRAQTMFGKAEADPPSEEADVQNASKEASMRSRRASADAAGCLEIDEATLPERAMHAPSFASPGVPPAPPVPGLRAPTAPSEHPALFSSREASEALHAAWTEPPAADASGDGQTALCEPEAADASSSVPSALRRSSRRPASAAPPKDPSALPSHYASFSPANSEPARRGASSSAPSSSGSTAADSLASPLSPLERPLGAADDGCSHNALGSQGHLASSLPGSRELSSSSLPASPKPSSSSLPGSSSGTSGSRAIYDHDLEGPAMVLASLADAPDLSVLAPLQEGLRQRNMRMLKLAPSLRSLHRKLVQAMLTLVIRRPEEVQYIMMGDSTDAQRAAQDPQHWQEAVEGLDLSPEQAERIRELRKRANVHLAEVRTRRCIALKRLVETLAEDPVQDDENVHFNPSFPPDASAATAAAAAAAAAAPWGELGNDSATAARGPASGGAPTPPISQAHLSPSLRSGRALRAMALLNECQDTMADERAVWMHVDALLTGILDSWQLQTFAALSWPCMPDVEKILEAAG